MYVHAYIINNITVYELISEFMLVKFSYRYTYVRTYVAKSLFNEKM